MKLSFFVFISFFVAASTVLAHGYVLDPPARQFLCADAGGNWWPEDGSGIPNEACRAAYALTNDPMLYTQVHEYAVNIPDYRNQAAVETAVSDGLLCSAGLDRYRGMSLVHDEWQKTSIPKPGGSYTIRFNASVPHSPSFFEVYLSRSGFDSSAKALSWQDLELLGTFRWLELKQQGNLRYYEMTVELPGDRLEGESAILFTRWQRNDTAGEGFYNCSDVVFSSQASAPEPTPPSVPSDPEVPEPPDHPPAPEPSDPGNPPPVASGEGLDVFFATQMHWDTGFNGVIHITNNGESVSNWVLKFKLAGTANVSETIWGAGGAIQHDSDGTVTITPNAWGGAHIDTGQTVSIFYGGTGTHAGAESCLINGDSCE